VLLIFHSCLFYVSNTLQLSKLINVTRCTAAPCWTVCTVSHSKTVCVCVRVRACVRLCVCVSVCVSLQTLVLDGNLLSALPAELGRLQRLVYLGLSFNEFTQVPPVLERLPAVERLCMAGNKVCVLTLQAFRLLTLKQIDLR